MGRNWPVHSYQRAQALALAQAKKLNGVVPAVTQHMRPVVTDKKLSVAVQTSGGLLCGVRASPVAVVTKIC